MSTPEVQPPTVPLYRRHPRKIALLGFLAGIVGFLLSITAFTVSGLLIAVIGIGLWSDDRRYQAELDERWEAKMLSLRD